MGKKTFMATTITSGLLISLIAGVQFVEVARANPFPTYPVISIESPTNKTYTANSLLLNVTLLTQWDGLYFTSENRIVNYCIDWKDSIQITPTEYKFDAEKQASIFSGSAVLTDLTEGTHNLRVNAEYHYDNGKQVFVSNSNVNFTIDPNYSPSLLPSPSPTLTSTPSPVKAQEPLNLTVKPDGSVEPSTDLLERNGNTYTFKSDILGTVTVRKAGITIDGAGYTLQGKGNQDVNMRGINLVGHDETFNAYGNVLVKNLRIYNFLPDGIYTPSNNNSFIGNRFERARLHIIGGSGVGNVIKHNAFIDSEIFVDYNNGGLDVITKNNFIDSTIFVDLAKPPIVDKNYWSNYTAEYPNAREVNSSAIWDTPNVYDKFIGGSHGNDPCIDYHPLVNPVADFEIPNFNITSPSPTSTPIPEFPLWIILPTLLIIIISVVAAIKRKKNHHLPKSAQSGSFLFLYCLVLEYL